MRETTFFLKKKIASIYLKNLVVEFHQAFEWSRTVYQGQNYQPNTLHVGHVDQLITFNRESCKFRACWPVKKKLTS